MQTCVTFVQSIVPLILKKTSIVAVLRSPALWAKYIGWYHILSRSEKRGACESDLCKIQLCNIKVTYMFIISSRTRRLKTCHHPNYFETCSRASNLKWTYFVHKIVQFLSLNICYIIYVLLWITYWLMQFEIIVVFILFKFKKRFWKFLKIALEVYTHWPLY